MWSDCQYTGLPESSPLRQRGSVESHDCRLKIPPDSLIPIHFIPLSVGPRAQCWFTSISGQQVQACVR